MQTLSAEQRQHYDAQGYVLISGVLDPADFKPTERRFLRLTEERSGRRFESLHDGNLLQFFRRNMQIESDVYGAIRLAPEIRDLATHPQLTHLLRQLEDRPWGLLEKMILRIDMPHLADEVAHWHQDHFYVRGNDRIVTAWIPLQNVTSENGCLLVQPASHTMGPVSHPVAIGKRHVPAAEVLNTFRPIPVDMLSGDVLLFHALLLHSGQLNRSSTTRYSLQFRYSPIGLPTDPGMGNVLPVET